MSPMTEGFDSGIIGLPPPQSLLSERALATYELEITRIRERIRARIMLASIIIITTRM